MTRTGASLPCVGGLSRAADPGVGTKVAFLSLPASYPEPTSRVDVRETHMSWVFLTDRHAWKLKKPVRLRDIDFGVAATRRTNCTEEVRLNRRLSDDVYLDVVPLSLDESGRLRLAGNGNAIDWLVKMRRLPAARMLDQLIAGGEATAQEVARVVRRLARFYRDSAPVEMTGEAFRRGFEQGIGDHFRELARPAFDLPPDLIATSAMHQRGLLERRPDLFDQRVAAGRIIEAHGDLRPEHICVEDEPQIIDCLEFSYPLRVLDAADELAFLALECERLGAPAFAGTIFETYAEVTGDAPPPALLAFYRSYRASVRAMLAIRHLDDPAPREPSRWAPQARAYLELACRHGALIA